MDRYQRLRGYLESFRVASLRLEEAISLAEQERVGRLYPFIRDSAIQRFEFTFELFWKLSRLALLMIEGVEVNSPKSVMRELFRNSYANEGEVRVLLKMVDERNLTVHTYDEAIAEELFSNLKGYLELMEIVVERIERAFSNL